MSSSGPYFPLLKIAAVKQQKELPDRLLKAPQAEAFARALTKHLTVNHPFAKQYLHLLIDEIRYEGQPGSDNFDFIIEPTDFVEWLDVRIKALARDLKKLLPEFGHRRLLESISVAGGFDSWHALHTSSERVIKQYQEEIKPTPLDNVLDAFAGCVPLVLAIKTDSPPNELERTAPVGPVAAGLMAIGARVGSGIDGPRREM